MLKTILIIIISVSILGILIFSIVRRAMKNKIEELVKNEKKRKKNYNFFSNTFNSFFLSNESISFDRS